jgi:hypothetical protein
LQQEHATLQHRLWSISQTIKRQTGIPSGFVHSLLTEIREIGQGFNTKQMAIQRDRDNMLRDINLAREQVLEKTRLLQNALRERDRACRERDAKESEIQIQSKNLQDKEQGLKEARLKMHKSRDRLRINEEELLRVNHDLLEKIQIQEEQLSAKRSLWLENHPSSSTRRTNSQSSRDPYLTPSGNHPPGLGVSEKFGGSDPAQQGPARFQKALMASTSSNRSGGSKSGRPSGQIVPSSTNCSGAILKSLRFEAEMPIESHQNRGKNWKGMPVGSNELGSKAIYTGSEELPIPSDTLTMVRYKSDDEFAEEFREAILHEWSMIEDWAKAYANIPNPLEFDEKLSQKPELWGRLLRSTGLKPQDAHSHVVNLLRSDLNRKFVVFRLITQYVCENMWDVSSYCGHDDISTETLKRARERLLEKGKSTSLPLKISPVLISPYTGLLPTERAEIVSQQMKTMQALEACDDFQEYRAFKLQIHTKALRELLGPLLNLTVVRAQAGRDIGAFAVYAFDLGVKMLTSDWAFRYHFPKSGERFGHTAMIQRDNLAESPLSMQIRQARLKFIITPIITMRRDTDSGNISPKQVAHAQVLIAT